MSNRWFAHLNVIELVWIYMKKQKQLRPSKSIDELWQVLQDSWNNQTARNPEQMLVSVWRSVYATQKQRVVTANGNVDLGLFCLVHY